MRACYIKDCSSYIVTHLTMYIWLRIPFRELSTRAGYYILRVFVVMTRLCYLSFSGAVVTKRE